MHLLSARRQAVTIGGERILSDAGERIVTEYAHKFRPADFANLAGEAGWNVIQRWHDARNWFAVFALELGDQGPRTGEAEPLNGHGR